MSPGPAQLCPHCARAVDISWKLCPSCGTALAARREEETHTVLTGASSASSVEEGRFPAGTVLAGRYRVLGLLGRGGMGEVYRAYDLILNQAVALKFLSGAHVSEAALARFRNEVRIARQVSHPNVCRVYDIGFVEGSHFLSMEYLDGEDLASLLRRIGRLPQDKAIEFTRKICAGLAAAHERGVLHRDLKPANIMIDGRGQVRITDFGLAALAQEVALGDIRSGTPAYMAPEQKAGREVTARSDIYSLGLTLYELFTGKRRGDTATNPTEIVKDLDPAVERVILRCLEEDPKRRPASPLSVAMALPGGDPVAAALAAGETPSPEMVAASEEKEVFTPRTAAWCLAFCVVALAVYGMFSDRNNIVSRAPLEIPPEGLAFHAKEILHSLGYPQQPKDSAYGFDYVDRGYVRYLKHADPAHFEQLLATDRPAVVSFWYRQHRADLEADSFLPQGFLLIGQNDVVAYDTPAQTEPGMIRLRLDAKGRLIALDARPVESAEVPAAPNWNPLFTAAELDPARFTSVEPRGIPPGPFDARGAWEGSFDPGRSERVHVEAAAWRGKPVWFTVGGDWQAKEPADVAALGGITLIELAVALPLFFGGAAILTWQNLRKGRGDRRGALQVAAFIFLAAMLNWAFGASHVASLWEFHLLVKALSWALAIAAGFWLLYLGLEPHTRRQWPDSLISWSRLQAGKLTDPLVGSHLLAGVAGILVIELYWVVAATLAGRYGRDLFPGPLDSQNSVPAFWAVFFTQAGSPIYFVLLFAIVLRQVIRQKLWLADAVAAILASLPTIAGYDNLLQNLLSASEGVLFNLAILWLLRRFGLLAAFAALLTDTIVSYVISCEFHSWYGGRVLIVLAVPLAMAAWGAWAVMAGRRRTAESASVPAV